MSQLQCSTLPQGLPWPHAKKAAAYLAQAKLEVMRALRLFPEEVPFPGRPHPARYTLQQVAGAISLLIGIVAPLAKDEPDESSISAASEQKSEVGGDPGSGKSAMASQIAAENARLSRKVATR